MLDQKYKDAIKLGFVFIVDDKGVRQTVISRKQALELGLKYYFTGKPCLHGHVIFKNRYGQCVMCTNQSSAKWRNDHPEKARLGNAKWRKDNPEKARAKDVKWRKDNPEKVRSSNAKWRKNNIEKAREKSRNGTQKWYKNNPEKVRELRLQRRSRLKFIKTNFSIVEQRKMLINQSDSCNICHKPFILKKECNCGSCKRIRDKSNLNGKLCYHVDHIIALASAEEYGKTVYNPEDFQLLCPSCNLRKGKKDMKEFIESIS